VTLIEWCDVDEVFSDVWWWTALAWSLLLWPWSVGQSSTVWPAWGALSHTVVQPSTVSSKYVVICLQIVLKYYTWSACPFILFCRMSVSTIDVKTCFIFFNKSVKKCVLCFLFHVFCAFLMSCFYSCENINVQNYKYDAFLMNKLWLALFLICIISISWTERVFCSSIIDFIVFVFTWMDNVV